MPELDVRKLLAVIQAIEMESSRMADGEVSAGEADVQIRLLCDTLRQILGLPEAEVE